MPSGGEIGRDALRKQHSALFLAKAREEAMLRAFEPLGENPAVSKTKKAGMIPAFFWRRDRDLNPSYPCEVNTISSRAP